MFDTHSPLVSIIIPVYNAEKTIQNCLNSLLAQSYKNIEILCVDDKSSDSGCEVIQRMMAQDNRIVLLRNPVNVGTHMTRKAGVLAARGDYIMFSDNDDWYEQNGVEVALSAILRKNVDILMYSARPVDIFNIGDDVYLSQRSAQLLAKPERIEGAHCICKINPMFLCWNRIIAADVCKKAYEQSEDIRLTHGEDSYMCWLMHYYANSFDTIPDILYNWVWRTGISSQPTRSIQSFGDVCNSTLNYLAATKRFLINVNAEPSILEHFVQACESAALPLFINQWSSTLSQEESMAGYQLLCNLYGETQVITTLHTQFHKLQNDYTARAQHAIELERKLEEVQFLLPDNWLVQRLNIVVRCYRRNGLLYTIQHIFRRLLKKLKA